MVTLLNALSDLVVFCALGVHGCMCFAQKEKLQELQGSLLFTKFEFSIKPDFIGWPQQFFIKCRQFSIKKSAFYVFQIFMKDKQRFLPDVISNPAKY